MQVFITKLCKALIIYSISKMIFAGGEGSILGAAGSVIGIGSDIGGSIRIPAFFNGIFGHKSSPGKLTKF